MPRKRIRRIAEALAVTVVGGLILAAALGLIRHWWSTSHHHISSAATSTVVAPQPSMTDTPQTYPNTNTTTSTTTTQSPPQVVWQHEFTFQYNASYGFDSFPPSKTDSVNGFGVELSHAGIAFTAVGATDAVQWTGKAQPTFAQCQDALASGGTDSIVIGASGLSPGGWICGTTDTHLIGRFRYDSGIQASSYTFFVTVWKPGQQ